MPIATLLTDLVTLQDAEGAAANGASLAVGEADSVLFEVTGTHTNITANFEASVDGGTTWHALGVLDMDGTDDAARVTTTTDNGLYQARDIAGLTHVRARTTVASPTGSMTVKVRTARVP